MISLKQLKEKCVINTTECKDKNKYIEAIETYLNQLPNLRPMRKNNYGILKEALNKHNLSRLFNEYFIADKNNTSRILIYIVEHNITKRKTILVERSNKYSLLSSRMSITTLKHIYSRVCKDIFYIRTSIMLRKKIKCGVDELNKRKDLFYKNVHGDICKITNIDFDEIDGILRIKNDMIYVDTFSNKISTQHEEKNRYGITECMKLFQKLKNDLEPSKVLSKDEVITHLTNRIDNEINTLQRKKEKIIKDLEDNI